MATTKRFLDQEGLAKVWAKIKENFVRKGELDTSVFIVVNELPTESIDSNKVYLVPSKVQGANNKYAEYIYVGGAWEKVGEFAAEVDLSGYALKKEIPTQLKWASAGNRVEMNLGYFKDGVFVDLPSLLLELATQDDAGLMSIEDKANLDRMSVDEGGSFDVSSLDGVSFRVPSDGGSSNEYEIVFRQKQMTFDDYTYDLPKANGTLALQSDITSAVSAKADSSALTALSEKVDAKADSSALPTAIEETEINDICK